MGKSLTEIESAFQNKHKQETSTQSKNTHIIEEIIEQKYKEKMQREGTKTPSRVILVSDIIFYATLIAMVLFTGLFFSGNAGSRTVGNYRFLEMLTPSMQSVYPKGSLLVVDEVSADDLNVGDDISYVKDNITIVTHRIEQIQEDYKGTRKRAFVTKGVDNLTEDPDVILADEVIGRVNASIPLLGAILSWVANNLLFILMAFLLLMTCSFGMKLFFGANKMDRWRRKS